MIIDIHLSNFYSINNDITLSLQAVNLRGKQALALKNHFFECGDEKLLKTVVIYGANASGKSNVIKAVRTCLKLILNSHNHNEDTVFNFEPFKFADNEKLSRFDIRFLIDGIEYEYSFSLTKTEIFTESLYFYPHGKKALVFTRDETKGKNKKDIYSFGRRIKRPLDVAESTSRKTLFISRASQMDRDIAKKVFSFFKNKVVHDYNDLSSPIFEECLRDNKKDILRLLKDVDCDIVDFRIKKVDQISKTLCITTFHKTNPLIPFDFDNEEATGTKDLFKLLPIVFTAVKEGKLLLIDGLDKGLHTKVIEFILSLFNDSDSAQLIFTTHNTNLLKRFRKDQVYFVNKDANGSSDLYSLYDFKNVKDGLDVEKAYLQGQFGAIPYINDLYDKII